MKHLIGKHKTKTVPFMDDSVEIKQLSVGGIRRLQNELSGDGESLNNIDTLVRIIREGVIGAEEMTVEELEEFPLLALTTLSTDIMEFSGVKAEEGND